MKLEDIGHMGSFGIGMDRERRVGNWSFYDLVDSDGMVRVVYHYGTQMGRIVQESHDTGWGFQPVSTGWGSVSDQGGMNKIIRRFGWYYSRKNGEAKYITLAEYNSGR